MDKFSKFNFITYFVIILGLSVYLSLFTGTHIKLINNKYIHEANFRYKDKQPLVYGLFF